MQKNQWTQPKRDQARHELLEGAVEQHGAVDSGQLRVDPVQPVRGSPEAAAQEAAKRLEDERLAKQRAQKAREAQDAEAAKQRQLENERAAWERERQYQLEAAW